MKIICDGQCGFCQRSVAGLKAMDWFRRLTFEPSYDRGLTEIQLIDGGKVYGGFDAFRRMCLVLPPLYPLIIFVYLPGSRIIGQKVYRLIAKRRYS